jgi:hypothetical protein
MFQSNALEVFPKLCHTTMTAMTTHQWKENLHAAISQMCLCDKVILDFFPFTTAINHFQ